MSALRPIRVKRQRMVQEGDLTKYVELAARRAGPGGAILVLLDADDDCPAELGTTILQHARAARADRPIRVVLARSEYETWFLASAASIAGQRGIEAAAPPDPESIRDAKGWLRRNLLPGGSCRPTRHQARFTADFDLDAARTAPSFDKLWRDMTSLLGKAGGGCR